MGHADCTKYFLLSILLCPETKATTSFFKLSPSPSLSFSLSPPLSLSMTNTMKSPVHFDSLAIPEGSINLLHEALRSLLFGKLKE